MVSLTTILCPVDGTDLGDATLDAAIAIGASLGAAKLVVLSVRSQAATLEQYKADMALDDIESEVKALEARARGRAAGTALSPNVIVGEVRAGALEATIVEASEEHHAQLIVMGTHGRKGLTEQVVGSSSERVVARATCSVLVVKPEGFPYLRE